MLIIKHVTLQKIVAHDFRYDPRIIMPIFKDRGTKRLGKKNSARYDRKWTQVSIISARYSCQISIKLQFSLQIFQKPSNINFHENPTSASRFLSRGQMDRRANRHDRANCRFSQFCERA